MVRSWELQVCTRRAHRSGGAGALYRRLLEPLAIAALNTMPGEKLIELRALGGLTLAFCQLLSMQNLERLIELGNLHRKAAEQMIPSELNLDFLNDSGTISFG